MENTKFNELSSKFNYACQEYNNEQFLFECTEYKEDLDLVYTRLYNIDIFTSQRNVCAFWTWYGDYTVDATFLDTSICPRIDDLMAYVNIFIAKYFV